MKDLPGETNIDDPKHCITTFMGTDAAVTKVATTLQNNEDYFFPNAYVLPENMKELKKVIRQKKPSYWIAKPRNDCAGQGIRVYEGSSKEFKKLLDPSDKSEKIKGGKQYVVQTYVERPLLIGGYKFHFRMYTVLAGVLDNFEAYLYKDGHALFSTKQFSMAKDTLGKNFDQYTHLTNWSINFVKNNPYLAENKELIGPGCEWAVSSTLKLIKKAFPSFCVRHFWKEMTNICARTMYRISQWKSVKRHKKENAKHRRFENFGLDLLMDEKFKIWLMEANTEVGLNPCYTYLPDNDCPSGCEKKNGCFDCRAQKNPRWKENNKVVTEVINSSIDLLQLDVPRSKRVAECLIPLHTVKGLDGALDKH